MIRVSRSTNIICDFLNCVIILNIFLFFAILSNFFKSANKKTNTQI